MTGGGAQRVMALLANHFSNSGHTISIITLNPGLAYELDSKIKFVRLHHGNFKIKKIQNFINLYKHYYRKNNRPNVIVSFMTLMNLITIPVAKIYGIPIIVSEHINHQKAPTPIYLSRFTRNFIYPYANYVTVLTKFDVGYYKKRRSKVVIMPNPCSFKIIENSIQERKKVILAIGNLDRYYHKGFDNLIDIVTPVLRKNKDWLLKIVGGGEQGHVILEKKIKENNLENQILLPGFSNKVKEIMKESSIFILPSRYEGLPMVLLEAMSQKMACIAFDCKTGPSDIIHHKKDGLLIEDQNIGEMQNGLLKLVLSKSLRDKYGTNASQKVKEFQIDKISKLWKTLFKSLN